MNLSDVWHQQLLLVRPSPSGGSAATRSPSSPPFGPFVLPIQRQRRMGVMRERERWKGPFCIYFVISFQFLSYLPTLKYFLLGCNSIHIFHDNFFGLLFNSIFIMKRKPSYNLYNSKTVLFLITRGQWPYRRAGQQGQ